MSEAQSTPLNQLPSPHETQNLDQDNAIVNEILNEIDSQNNSQTNQSVFERQIDSEANTPQNSISNPTPEQIQQMNEINQQNQMQQLQAQQQLQVQQQKAAMMAQQQFSEADLQMKIKEDNTLSQVNTTIQSKSLLDYLKDSLLVVGIFFLFTFAPINKLLSKIPRTTSSTGNITIIGNGIKSLLAGVIFLLISKFV